MFAQRSKSWNVSVFVLASIGSAGGLAAGLTGCFEKDRKPSSITFTEREGEPDRIEEINPNAIIDEPNEPSKMTLNALAVGTSALSPYSSSSSTLAKVSDDHPSAGANPPSSPGLSDRCRDGKDKSSNPAESDSVSRSGYLVGLHLKIDKKIRESDKFKDLSVSGLSIEGAAVSSSIEGPEFKVSFFEREVPSLLGLQMSPLKTLAYGAVYFSCVINDDPLSCKSNLIPQIYDSLALSVIPSAKDGSVVVLPSSIGTIRLARQPENKFRDSGCVVPVHARYTLSLDEAGALTWVLASPKPESVLDESVPH